MQFIFSNFPPPNRAIFEIMWENITERQATYENNENMGYAHNILDY